MEINVQQTNTQQSATPISSAATPPITEQQSQAKESGLNTASTVNLSTEAQKLSTEPKNTENAQPLTTRKQAEESVIQLQKDAANDPVQTQLAQSNSLTSDQVSRLIG